MNNSENQNSDIKKSKNEDEIDMIPVLKSIGAGISSFFSRFFNFILSILSFLFSTISSLFINTVLLFRKLCFAIAKHKIFFIIILLSGTTAGFFSHQFIRPFYTGILFVSSQGLKGLYFSEAITILDDLAEEESHLELARKLNITTIISKGIKGIEIESAQFSNTRDELVSEISILENTIESIDKSDSSGFEKKFVLQERINTLKFKLEMQEKYMIKNEDEFKISFFVYDPKILPVLKEGVINYLINNPFGKKRIELKIQDLEKQKNITHEQITKLDTLTKIIDKSYTEFYTHKQESLGSNNILLGGQTQSTVTPPDPFLIYKEVFQLKEERLKIEKDLFLVQNLEIIQDLTIFQKPSNFGKIQTTGIGVLAGFALFLFFLGIMNLKYLNEYLDKKESHQAEKRKKSQDPNSTY